VNRGILSSSVEVLSSAMTSSTQRARSLCNTCLDGYERERAEMASSELALRPAEQWLQIGMPRPLDRAQVGSLSQRLFVSTRLDKVSTTPICHERRPVD
jgi:hypothetical protein